VIEHRVSCDNPQCTAIGVPEDYTSHTKYTAPYGWLVLRGTFIGRGPDIIVEVCNTTCIEAAVVEAIRKAPT
jgi:hypothetical protein